MKHSQIEAILYKAIRKGNREATLSKEAKVGNMHVDILQKRKGRTIAYEIKMANFFDGFGRAVVWKNLVDSVYLIVPRNILPSEQITNEMPDQIGVIAFEYKNNHVRFKLIKKAAIDLPAQILEHDFNLETKSRPTKRYTTTSLVSPKALRIVKYLLTHEKTTQKNISQKTGVSIGMVNKVVSRLADREIVAYKKRTLTLLEPWKLLNEVSWERPMTKLKIRDIYVPQVKGVHEAEEYLKNICNQHEIDYALTLFSGASRYMAYSMRYDTVYSYVEPSDRFLSLLAESRNTVKKGMRLELFMVDSPDILEEAKTFDGLSVCSPAQVLIDISSYGYAGKDVAVELYRQLSQR